MSSINNEQKQLLFDYCVGLTSQEESVEAEALISSNQEAAEIHSQLRATLAPLESVEFEPCPDGLVERTVWRVSNLADSGQHRLEQLLVSEQTQKVTTKVAFWRNLSEMAAVAAAVILIAAVLVPTLSFARQKYAQQRCRMQLGSSIFQGLDNYISDHDGQLPAVASAAGAPWWKVGSKDNENCSNTRHIWLLVKGNYVKPTSFVCPGCKNGKTLQSSPSQIRTYKDFPNRKHITYSFRIRCRMHENGKLLCRKVLMADLSPLFEKLPDDFPTAPLRLNPRLLTINSINHRRRGQSVLFGDGRVEFLKTRHIGISKDDIFTLQDTDIYQGCEVPSCATDSFLAP